MISLPKRYTFKGKTFDGGGMSSAYLCTDTHLDRPVLIKRLHDGVEQSRLQDEIAALTAIRSKHVVQIYDVIKDEAGAIIGIVEEYLEGDELGSLAPIKDEMTFIRTIHDVACGIADIHMYGRVHRDIKPNNMKFDAEGTLKIYDFGLSRPDDLTAKTIGAVGTLGFIAPELCVEDDEVAVFSQPVDVYAFGATALVMMTNALPAGLRRVPPQLPCRGANFGSQGLALPPAITHVLNACLSEKAADRPSMQTVRDVFHEQLTAGKHRATLVIEGTRHVLSAANPVVNISGGSLGHFQIRYDGLRFIITAMSGDIYINARRASVNDALPGACVIALGDPSLAYHRKYVTVDVSHPGVAV